MENQLLLKMDNQLSAWEDEKDNRRYFLQCYRLMTANMLKAIEKKEFIDNQWVNELLEHFAEYYFNALDQFERQLPTPNIWKEVFERTIQTDLAIIQAMILGVNAHINYDLIFCLKDLLEEEWNNLSSEQRKARYKDHREVNRIIASTIDEVQDEVIEPGNYIMKVIDSIFGRLDEYLLSKLITSWREDVWKMAIQLIECPEEEKSSHHDLIEQKALRKMEFLKISL